GIHARATLGRLSEMGLGNRGLRTSAFILKAVRFSDRVKRAHPSSNAKGGGQYYVSYGAFDCVSAARSRGRCCTRTYEGPSRRSTGQDGWYHSGPICRKK